MTSRLKLGTAKHTGTVQLWKGKRYHQALQLISEAIGRPRLHHRTVKGLFLVQHRNHTTGVAQVLRELLLVADMRPRWVQYQRPLTQPETTIIWSYSFGKPG